MAKFKSYISWKTIAENLVFLHKNEFVDLNAVSIEMRAHILILLAFMSLEFYCEKL